MYYVFSILVYSFPSIAPSYTLDKPSPNYVCSLTEVEPLTASKSKRQITRTPSMPTISHEAGLHKYL